MSLNDPQISPKKIVLFNQGQGLVTMRNSPVKINRDSDTTSRFVTFKGEQIGNFKMSHLDDFSTKNVTFYGPASNKVNLRSGAVNLKLKQGTIPTTDFDELNRLIDGDTS
jgi:hypothetical protein